MPAVDDCLLNQVLPRCYHGWVDEKTSFLRLTAPLTVLSLVTRLEFEDGKGIAGILSSTAS